MNILLELVVISLLITYTSSEIVNGESLSLILFNSSFSSDSGARCLDGSPSGYYKRDGSNDKFVIFLEGGGACYTVDPEAPSSINCASRAKTSLGSSLYWSQTYDDTDNILSANATINAFSTFTAIFVPYCSGDVHLGQRTSVVDPKTFPYFFAGHLTVQATINHLKETSSLSSAKELLLSGSSAGGIGSALNADFVASLLPGVNVRSAPQGGWFFPPVVNFTSWKEGENGPPYFGQDSLLQSLWQAYEVPSCVSTMGSGYCSSVNFAFPFIKTPMHVSENLMDSNQLFAQLGVPQDSNNVTLQYISPYFITAMKTGLRQITSSSLDSVWAPGCVKHTENLNLVSSTLVSGIMLKQSLDSWYFNGNVSPYLIDTCQGVNCGDGCGSINVDESEYMTQWLF
jgi:hypothetical protein